MTRRLSSFLGAALVAGWSAITTLAAPGCSSTGVGNPGLKTEEQALVDDGNEGNSAGDTASSIVSIPALAISAPSELADPATAAATATFSTKFFTGGCATADHVAGSAVVTYTFTNCTGALGLAQLKGQLVATFTPAPTGGGMRVAITSSGLTLNGIAVTQSATATLSFVGAARKIVWDGKYDSFTRKGLPVSHAASYTIEVDSSCVSLDGSSSTTLGSGAATRTFTTTIAGYRRCGTRVHCPESGDVTLDTPKGLKLLVHFEGGPHALVSNLADGRSIDIALSCE